MRQPLFLVLRPTPDGAPRPPPDPPEPVKSPPGEDQPVQPLRVEPDPPKPVQAAASEGMRMAPADQIEAAQRFAEVGQPMTLLDPERPHQEHLVSRDLADPDVWRHTELVDGRPFLDAEFTAAEDAFLSALRSGGVPAYQDEPAAHATKMGPKA